MTGEAGRIAKDDARSSERSVARRIGRTENAHHGDTKCGCKVHRSSVSADKEACTASKRNEFGQRASNAYSGAAACSLDGMNEFALSWAEVDQRLQSIFSQSPGDITVTFCRPLLRSPARARIQNGEFTDFMISQAAINFLFDCRVAGKFHPRHGKWATGDGLGERKVLLNNVSAASDDLARIPHAGGVFTSLRGPVCNRCSRPARQQRRSHSSLKIDSHLVMNRTQLAQPGSDLFPGAVRKQRRSPGRRIDGVDLVDKRPLRRAPARTRRPQRAKQLCPAFFDDPPNHGLRKCMAQCSRGGKRMDDVAHGTEPHDEQPLNVSTLSEVLRSVCHSGCHLRSAARLLESGLFHLPSGFWGRQQSRLVHRIPALYRALELYQLCNRCPLRESRDAFRG